MTTKLAIERNNITSTISLTDSWAYAGLVVLEETLNNTTLYSEIISPERAENLALDLLGAGWRVIQHSL
jgi:hypothetical protein